MERYKDIEGGYNIRDIGGYQTNDGGTIKWGVLYRAGLLSRINLSKTDKMEKLQLRTICDFRTNAEQTASPDRWHNINQLQRFSFPIGEGRVDKLEQMKASDLMEGDNHHLYRANRSYVMRETERYRDFFKVLLDEKNYPLLYHCTAGKDRTGFATFLLLSLLGVEKEQIVNDYLLTNRYLKTFIDSVVGGISKNIGIQEDLVRSIFLAKEEYLAGATTAIEQNFGTVKNYLEKELLIGPKEITKLKTLLIDY